MPHASVPARGPYHVAILAFDGCLTTAVTGVCDVLQTANLWATHRQAGTPFEVRVYAAESGLVTGSAGFALPAAAISGATAVDIAIVPPVFGPIEATLVNNPVLLDWLRARPRSLIASVCTGAFFLAEAGLLSGCRATTNPAFAKAFRRRYQDVELSPDQRLTQQGQILCAGSSSACFDLAFYLIERFADHELAVLVAKTFCIDVRQGSQVPFFVYIAPKDHGDDAVLALQEWIEAHYADSFSAADLARRAGMGQRTFHRRFRNATGLSPVDYLHRVRVERAKRHLENSTLSVDEITAEVGYEDARSFSRLFRTLVDVSPREYRERFGARAGLPARGSRGDR